MWLSHTVSLHKEPFDNLIENMNMLLCCHTHTHIHTHTYTHTHTHTHTHTQRIGLSPHLGTPLFAAPYGTAWKPRWSEHDESQASFLSYNSNRTQQNKTQRDATRRDTTRHDTSQGNATQHNA